MAPVRRIITADVTLGSRLPAATTSMGRVILASRSDKDILAFINKSQIKKHTSNSKTAKEIIKSIHDARRSGYALVDQDLEVGLLSLAVPIVNRAGLARAALGVSTITGRSDGDSLIQKCLKPMQEAATKISTIQQDYL